MGEKTAGIGALLLFVFMFLDWFGIHVSGPGRSVSLGPGAGGSAWNALDFIPLVLAITIAIAVLNASLRLLRPDYVPPASLNVVAGALGGVSTLSILYRIIDPPVVAHFGSVSADATPEIGIFLSLFAAAAIAFGGYRAMREEGVVFAGSPPYWRTPELPSGGHRIPPPGTDSTTKLR